MNTKSKFKAGLPFGIGMAVFFSIQSLLERDNLTLKGISISVFSGLLGGAFSGILFGWMIGWMICVFRNSEWLKRTTKIDTEADETILFETGANHFKGIEGIGGKLYLTNKRLVFKSHSLNIQKHQLSINLRDINCVDRYKPMGVVNNGLSINTIENRTEKFVVELAVKWIAQLHSTTNGLQYALLKK